MNEVNEPNDTDFFTRVASHRISRRDMVKASVIAGGLVWTAPVLLSGTASAQVESCCTTGTPVTVTIDPAGVLSCGIATCLIQEGEDFDCDPDMLECLEQFGIDATIEVVNNPQGDHTEVHVDLLNGIILLGVAVNTTGGTNADPCALVKVIDPNDDCDFPNAPNNIVIPGGFPHEQVQINFDNDEFGELVQVELTICVPATFSALCG
jgi:hypothetical protein